MTLDELKQLPPKTPTGSTPPTGSTGLSLDQLNNLPKVTDIPAEPITPQPNIVQNRSVDVANAIDTYSAGKQNIGDVALQTGGAIAGLGNDVVSKIFDKLGISSVIGGLQKVATAGGGAVGSVLRSVNPGYVDEQKKLMSDKVNAFLNHPAVAPVIKTINQLANDPKVVGDLKAVGNIAQGVGTVAGGIEAARAVPEGVAATSKAIGNVADVIGKKAEAKFINSSASDWQRPVEINKPGFKNATEIFDKGVSKGNDIPRTLVQNGIKLSDNVDGGNYATSETADQLRADAAKMSRETLRPSLQMADYSTPKTPVSEVVDSTINDIKSSKGITPGDEEAQIAKAQSEGAALARKYPDGMSLTDMHDEKISYTNNKYSPIGPKSDTISSAVDRSFGRSLAKTVEAKAPEGIPVKEFNAELEKQFQVADYLDSLNGKKVSKTILSRIAQTTAKVLGASVGHGMGGGILGTVGGYHIGGMLESMVENLPNPIKGYFLDNLERTNPQAFEAVKGYIGDEAAARLQRKMLPEPSFIAGKPYKGGEPVITPSSRIKPPMLQQGASEKDINAFFDDQAKQLEEMRREALKRPPSLNLRKTPNQVNLNPKEPKSVKVLDIKKK